MKRLLAIFALSLCAHAHAADLTMIVDTALEEVPVNIFPLTDDGDFKSIEGAVAYNAAGMTLRWHFVDTDGDYTVTSVTPTTGGVYDWTDQGDSGIYTIEIPASGGGEINNDTEGFGWFTGLATGVLPWRGPTITFVPANVANSLTNGIDNLEVDANGAIVRSGSVGSSPVGSTSVVLNSANASDELAGCNIVFTRSSGEKIERTIISNSGATITVDSAVTLDEDDDLYVVTAGSPKANRATPNAVAGASGGLLIAGANTAATSFTGGLTISSASGSALTLSSSGGNGHGLTITGNGTGEGILATGGASGHGMELDGGASGDDLALTGDDAPDLVTVLTDLEVDVTKIGGSAAEVVGESEFSALVAEGVWDTPRASYTAAGSFGQGVASVQGNVTGSVASVTGAVGSVTAGVTVSDKTGFRLSSTGVDDIWDELKAGHTVADSFGDYLDDEVSTAASGGLSLAEIVDGVWDQDATSNQDQGSFGQVLGDSVADATSIWSLANKLDTAVELDGSVYRLTTNALEQAPSGSQTNPQVLVSTTVAAVTSQTEFTLTDGSSIDGSYEDQAIVLYDASASDYPSVRMVAAYTGSTKTVTLDSAPDFTLLAGDGVKVFTGGSGGSASSSGGPIEHTAVPRSRTLQVRSRSDGTFGVIGRVRMTAGETLWWAVDFAGTQVAAGDLVDSVAAPTITGAEAANLTTPDYGILGTQVKFKAVLSGSAETTDTINVVLTVTPESGESFIVTVPVTVGP